jgi:predicted anti-sigma-YlaC factor YlaD
MRFDDQSNAPVGVTCAVYREALSAQMDGEHAPVETSLHLARCEACAEWARVVPNLQRPLRMRAADEVPDLAERILTAIIGTVPRPSPALSLTRAALMAVAIMQAVAGALHLLTHAGAGQHTAAELGAWSFATGIAFGTAALRPKVAYAVLPMVIALVAVLGYASVRDLSAGEVSVQRVLEHTLIVAGLLLVGAIAWLMRRRPPRRPTSAVIGKARVRGLLPR